MTYSLDLINAAINYYKTTTYSLRKVGNIFAVSKSAIEKWVKELPLKYKKEDKITDNKTIRIINFIKNSLNHNPYQTQIILQQKIYDNLNIDISLFQIRKYMTIIGYTKKKVSRKLFNKNLKELKSKRKNFKKNMKKVDKKKIICIDEVGTTKETFNKYGYCHKSKRLQCYVDAKQLPQKRSIIVAISNDKVVHYKILKNKNVNNTIYLEFINELCSMFSNKILLMDNVSFHKNKNIKEAIENTQNELLLIPPYSPDCNPIEEVFSLFKSYLRSKINVITGFIKLDIHIRVFFTNAIDFNKYYSRAFD